MTFAAAGLGQIAPRLNPGFLVSPALAATNKDLIFLSSENLSGNWNPTQHTLLSQLNLEGFIYGYLTRAPMRPENPEEIVWELATGMKPVDKYTLEISLRKGVKFHDGSPFTAKDVKATFEYASQLNRPAQWYPGPCEVQIVDDHTCRVLTEKYKYPASLFYLLVSFLPIMSAKDIADEKILAQRPNGAGPFKFVEQKGEATILAANKEYCLGAPKIPGLQFVHVHDATTRALSLMSGQADIVERLEAEQADTLKKRDDVKLVKVLSVENKYLMFRCCKPPFDNAKLRLAACHAIDRKVIVDVVGDAAHFSKCHISPVKFGYVDVPDYPEFDAARCQALLAEAGFPGGKGLPELEFITSIGFYPKTKEYGEVIAEMLKAQGFPVKLTVMETAAWNDALWHTPQCSRGHMIDVGWASGSPEPDIVIRTHFHSSVTRVAGIADKELDASLDKERQAASVEERKRILQTETLPLIAHKAPGLSLFTSVFLYGVRKNLDGLYVYPNGMMNADNAVFV